MFTEPKIVTSDNLQSRSYVTFYFNRKRIREYNGKSINQSINPNRANSISERHKLLKRLQFEIHKALDLNQYPSNTILDAKEAEDTTINTIEILTQALNRKLNSDLSKTYKRNLLLIHKDFIESVKHANLCNDINQIKTVHIDEFLSQYKSSGTYYMNKRRDLGVLFLTAGRISDQSFPVVKKTESQRSKAKLHKAYEKSQLKSIFNYLKEYNYNVYLCCLLTYGCWLRPHEEVRLLKKLHFKNNFSEVHLSGNENKSLKVRVVYVPDYVQKELTPILNILSPEENIFTRAEKPFNDAYFNTQRKRLWL